MVGEPRKVATNWFSRAVVEVERGAELLHVAGVQHHDPVRQRHRLHLVVGDVDHRGVHPPVQLGDLEPRLDAQRRVEVGERLVEQENLGVAHDRPADGDALALAAGEVLGQPVEELVELQDARRFLHLRLDCGIVGAAAAETERHVLVDAHVRVERVGLEHHRDPALGRRQRVDALAVDHEVAGGDVLQPRHQPQQGGLAAARRADEDHELLIPDVEVDPVDRLHAAERLADPVHNNRCHQPRLPPFLCFSRDRRA